MGFNGDVIVAVSARRNDQRLIAVARIALIVRERSVEFASGGNPCQCGVSPDAINVPRSSIKQCSNCSASSM